MSNPIETVTGTAGNDSVDKSADGTRQLISALAGNDTVTGGTNSDTLDGGAGNDSLIGGLGNDSLIGGLGNDTLSGDAGNDFYVYTTGDKIVETVGGGIDALQVAGTLQNINLTTLAAD